MLKKGYLLQQYTVHKGKNSFLKIFSLYILTIPLITCNDRVCFNTSYFYTCTWCILFTFTTLIFSFHLFSTSRAFSPSFFHQARKLLFVCLSKFLLLFSLLGSLSVIRYRGCVRTYIRCCGCKEERGLGMVARKLWSMEFGDRGTRMWAPALLPLAVFLEGFSLCKPQVCF